jgi:hypothetical protein
MNKTITILFAAAVSVFAAGGCKKHDAAPATTGSGSAAMTGSGSGSGSAGSAMAAGSAAAGSAAGSAAAVDVPTPADFEAQAGSDITDKNLDSSLDALEKDLGK